MKHLLFVVPFLFISCSLLPTEEALRVDLPEGVSTLEQAEAWIVSNIERKAEKEGRDHWKYPQETLDDGCGDCEDLNILMLAFARALGVASADLELYFVIPSSDSLHAVAYVAGEYFDPSGFTDGVPPYPFYKSVEYSQLAINIERRGR